MRYPSPRPHVCVLVRVRDQNVHLVPLFLLFPNNLHIYNKYVNNVKTIDKI